MEMDNISVKQTIKTMYFTYIYVKFKLRLSFDLYIFFPNRAYTRIDKRPGKSYKVIDTVLKWKKSSAQSSKIWARKMDVLRFIIYRKKWSYHIMPFIQCSFIISHCTVIPAYVPHYCISPYIIMSWKFILYSLLSLLPYFYGQWINK